MPKIKDLNPIGNIHGSDLAIPYIAGDRVEFSWGDSFQTPLGRAEGPPKRGLSNWRSPVLSTDRDMLGGGRQLRPYPHDGSMPEGVTTFLPTDAVTVNGIRYMWVMATRGLADHKVPGSGEKWCEIWTKPVGQEGDWDWDGHKWGVNAFAGLRRMVTWDRGRDGYVYIISTTGLHRDRNAIMHRVKEEHILNESKWEHWFYDQGKRAWRWDAQAASEILQRGYRLMEINLRWIQGHWVFSGGDAGQYNAFVKVGYGDITKINWHTTWEMRPIKGMAGVRGGPDIVNRLYGIAIHPLCKFTDKNWVMHVSTWSEDGGEYKAMQYSVPTPPAQGELVSDTVAPANPSVPNVVRQITLAPGETIEVKA